MITENDLKEAIAECQGVRKPNAAVCIKLASYYSILDHMKGDAKASPIEYSYAAPNVPEVVDYSSDSQFFRLANGKDIDKVWAVVDELMLVLQAINPKLYEGVLNKLV